jgi:hypothetical protein
MDVISAGCLGDFADIYCESCFNIGKEYFDRFKKEQEKFDTIMRKIECEWRAKAIEAANQQKKSNIIRKNNTQSK